MDTIIYLALIGLTVALLLVVLMLMGMQRDMQAIRRTVKDMERNQ